MLFANVCAGFFSFPGTELVVKSSFLGFWASPWCLVHLGGASFASLPPCVYKAWVSKMCLLLDMLPPRNRPLHALHVPAGLTGSCGGTSSAAHTVTRCCGCCHCVFTFDFFPYFSSFATLIHVSLFLISLPFISSVSSGLRNSLISSSHLFFGLPTGLYVWCLMLRLGFHSTAFFAHLSFGSDAILVAKRHFALLCVSIQHGILASFILSTAEAVLLFMYSIHSSSSISAVSITSSVSSMKETSLSWSQSVFELLPSAVSSSELLWFSFSPSPCWSKFSFCIFFLFG